MKKKQIAENLAQLTFNLLARCEKKEAWIANSKGLTSAELKCLRLFEPDETINNKKLAKRMTISPSRLTRIIDELVKKGYVIREINTEDRRHMNVYLSKKGKLLSGDLQNEFIEVHSEILNEIDVSQHASLITSMENLHTAVEKWLRKPR